MLLRGCKRQPDVVMWLQVDSLAPGMRRPAHCWPETEAVQQCGTGRLLQGSLPSQQRISALSVKHAACYDADLLILLDSTRHSGLHQSVRTVYVLPCASLALPALTHIAESWSPAVCQQMMSRSTWPIACIVTAAVQCRPMLRLVVILEQHKPQGARQMYNPATTPHAMEIGYRFARQAV